MRRIGTDAWAGLAMLAISIGVAAPALFGAIEPVIARGLWVVLFALFLASILIATAAPTSKLLRYGGFAVAVVAAWTLVLTAQATGLLLVLLVITAATSVYIVPLWMGLVVVALNTGVVLAVTVPNAVNVTESVILTGFYLLIQLATLLSSATLIREQRMRRELAEAHVELRAASVMLSESARTAERLRISRELHDLIGHQLTVLTLELETARHVDGEDARGHLDRADRVARELLRDVRRTVGQLRSEGPDLEHALRQMTSELPGLAVTIDVDPQLRIGEAQSAALVRAAQEIVTNTLRHAEARELWIEVRSEQDAVALRAQDDGRGAPDVVFGNGLEGLRERLAELGGEISVDGRRGFAVAARVPAS
ncbi:sensor histidine kinase [Agromyces aerolatus]|uniref:sensor histidine kinase n=1 Tax=Agromyces sp. LY-1074 TaxID=3074080 RepID=UPI002857DA13|nr:MULTISPECIES: histidine kinase [unclassified Agromyces]MDR5700154.1 histidine kinase [Agromyces sp. LY-1074]MDR5706478.1 histidine kinase [Agromyces sp. LY-1358]